MSIHLYYHSIEMVGLTSLLLLLIGVLRQKTTNFSTWALIALVISCMCYLVRMRQEYSYWIPEELHLASGWWDMPLDIGLNAFAGLFSIFVFSLFRDYRRIPTWFLALFAFQLALEPFSHRYSYGDPEEIQALAPGLETLFVAVPRWMQLFFNCVTFYWVILGWRGDLLDNRRLLRRYFLAYQASASILAVLLTTFFIQQNQYTAYQVHVGLVSLNCMFVFSLVAITFKPDLSLILDPNDVEEVEPESSRPEANKDWEIFNERFFGEFLYRTPGLSVSSLARMLALPEYRLRKLITENLGFKNFNALLHEYRLREAAEALVDSNRSHLPILTIALETGYQSINPFNRAFKEKFGKTPSAYRAENT